MEVHTQETGVGRAVLCTAEGKHVQRCRGSWGWEWRVAEYGWKTVSKVDSCRWRKALKSGQGSGHEGPCKLCASWWEFVHQNIKTPVDHCCWGLHFCTNVVGAQDLIIQCLEFDGCWIFWGAWSNVSAIFSGQKLTLTTSSE